MTKILTPPTIWTLPLIEYLTHQIDLSFLAFITTITATAEAIALLSHLKPPTNHG